MKNYHITVNGQTYEVTVEEVSAEAFSQAPAAQAAPRPAVSTSAGVPVNAPMPGTIIAVNTQVGAQVKAGDVLCILEAMKMENEIVAPQDGTVSEVLVAKGAQVESGATLVKL